MTVARAGGGLALGLGTTSGQVFVVTITDNLAWLALETDTSTKQRVTRCI